MASPLNLIERPDWFVDPTRGCANVGDVMFFAPDLEKQSRKFDTKPAKALCSRCPFQAECLEYALREDQRFGVWGGTDEKERRAIMRCLKGTCSSRCKHTYRSGRTTL